MKTRAELDRQMLAAVAELDEAHDQLDRLGVPRFSTNGVVYPIVARLAYWVMQNGSQEGMRRRWLNSFLPYVSDGR